MNIRNILMTACALSLWCGTGTMAQETGTFQQPERQQERQPDRPQEERPERHYKPLPLSPEKMARHTTERMDSLLGLTEKQYDKLYTLYLKEARRQAEKTNTGAGRPHMERRPGGGPGGHPGFGGGNPPSGGRGMGPGGNGNRPPEGFGQRPPHDSPMPSDSPKEMEKQRKKTEKKIRKILTEEQYARWQEERQRPPMGPEGQKPGQQPDRETPKSQLAE